MPVVWKGCLRKNKEKGSTRGSRGPPRFFSKSCSFQALLRKKPSILSKFWAQGPPPPPGIKTLLVSPDQNPGSAPGLTQLLGSNKERENTSYTGGSRFIRKTKTKQKKNDERNFELYKWADNTWEIGVISIGLRIIYLGIDYRCSDKAGPTCTRSLAASILQICFFFNSNFQVRRGLSGGKETFVEQHEFAPGKPILNGEENQYQRCTAQVCSGQGCMESDQDNI